MSLQGKLERSFLQALNDPVYEPKQRLSGGKFGWVRHRFPIRGGISSRQTMIADMYSAPNPLWEALMKKTKG